MKITQDIRDYSEKVSIIKIKDILKVNKSLD
jgi:hypothetical protein